MRRTLFALAVSVVVGSTAGRTSGGSPEAAGPRPTHQRSGVWRDFVACTAGFR